MLYIYTKENLMNYREPIDNPMISKITDVIVATILGHVIAGNSEYTHTFDENIDLAIVDIIIKRMRIMFPDALIIQYTLRNLDKSIKANRFYIDWTI